jgi:tryptophan synthase alpha chain
MKIDIKTNNRITDLFAYKNKKILSVYFTAGFPHLDSTYRIIKHLSNAGAEMIEIGIPFSDPIADGEVIQKSSQQALKNGMSLKLLFDQLREIRKITDIPLVAMGYLNPIYRFGFEKFCGECEQIGIDGLIIPDLPLKEITESYGEIMNKHNLKNIMLISPNTSEKRIKDIDKLTTGFIYMVSSASTTGAKSGLTEDQLEYFIRINEMGLDNSKVIGFGISDRSTFNTACRYADGAIIGSAFIKHLEQTGDSQDSIIKFIESIRS